MSRATGASGPPTISRRHVPRATRRRVRAEERLTLRVIDTPAPLRMLDRDSGSHSGGGGWRLAASMAGSRALRCRARLAAADLLRRVTQSTPTVSPQSPSPPPEPATNAGIAVMPRRRLTIDVARGRSRGGDDRLTDSGEVILRGWRTPSFSPRSIALRSGTSKESLRCSSTSRAPRPTSNCAWTGRGYS